MKTVKKIFKYLLVLLGVVVALLIILPIIFKDDIVKYAKKEADKYVNAEVYIEDVGISFFSSFPNLLIDLENFGLISKDERFSGDTVVHVSDFYVELDIKSVFGGNVKIHEINLEDVYANILVNKDTIANYETIMRETPATDSLTVETNTVSSEEMATNETDTASSEPIKIDLKKFKLSNVNLVYDDVPGKQLAKITDLNYDLSGNFSEDFSTLKMEVLMEKLFYALEGVTFANNLNVKFESDIEADTKNNTYTLKENTLQINRLITSLIGQIQLLGDTTNVDLKLSTNEIDFKSLLSFIPVDFKTDISDLKTQGVVKLSATAKGDYYQEHYPAFALNLLVKNALLQYPDLPEKIEAINVNVDISKPNGDLDKTMVDVKQFDLSIAKNPVHATLLLKTPMSDPFFKSEIKAEIDFNTLKDAIPLEDMKIEGTVNSDLRFQGNLSTIEKEDYENFDAEGNLSITDFVVDSKAYYHHKILINKAIFNFTPKYIDLKDLVCKIAKSDFRANGKVYNYIPYGLKDETLKATLNFSSNLIDGVELTPPDEATSTEKPAEKEETEEQLEPTQTVSSGSSDDEPLIPGNIDFTLNMNVKKVLYDVSVLENIRGRLKLKDSRAIFEKISLNTLKGLASMDGWFDSKGTPKTKLAMRVKGVDMKEAATTYNTVEKMAGIMKSIEGKVDMNFEMDGSFDDSLNINLKSLNAFGELLSDEIQIQDNKMFEIFGSLLKSEKLKNPKVKNIDINFLVQDGKLIIKENNLKVEDVNINYQGFSTLDQQVDFDVLAEMPTTYLGESTISSLQNTIDNTLGKYGIKYSLPKKVKIPAKITGPASRPKVSLNLNQARKEMTNKVKEEVKGQAKKVAKKKVNEAKEEAKKILKEEAENLLKGNTEDIKKKGEDALKKLFGLPK